MVPKTDDQLRKLDLEPLILVDDLARILGRTKAGIYQLRDRGKLPPAIKVGGCLGWAPRDIRKWLESRKA